jgi:GNAT superfamily N-acetyltransferase
LVRPNPERPSLEKRPFGPSILGRSAPVETGPIGHAQAMTTHVPAGTSEGDAVVVRPAEEGDREAVAGLLGGAHQFELSFGPCDGEDDGTALYVALDGGQVVGAAWVGEGEGGAELRFACQHEANRGQAPRMLLAAAAQFARERRLPELHTTVTLEDQCSLAALRDAGFRVTSAFAVGGATRLSLAVA